MCLWLYNELKSVEFGSKIERAVILALGADHGSGRP